MPKSHAAYAPEFRRQMVELVRSGRTPEELSVNSSRPRSRSGTGFARLIAMMAAGTMERRAVNVRSWRAGAVRTGSYGRSAISWQRQQPGSHGRPQ